MVEIDGAGNAVVAGVLGLIALAMGVRKLHAIFAKDGVAVERAGGESDVIRILREEVGRLAGINAQLATSLNQLQTEIVELRGENAELKAEIRTLNGQIKTMRRVREECRGCPKLVLDTADEIGGPG